MKSTRKKFDCVQMKWAAQEKIRECLRGMSIAEEIAYFRQGAEEFERKISSARKKVDPGGAQQE
jgi:hypothetical protein